MKKFINKWNVLIYTLIVINLALILIYIVSSRTNNFLYSVLNNSSTQTLSANIKRKADLSFKYNYLYNLNWSWFADTRICPTNVSFSWITASWWIFTIPQTILTFWTNNVPFCSWSISSWTLNVFYNNDYLSFSSISFSWYSLTNLNNDWTTNTFGSLILTWNVYSTTITGSTNYFVSFSGNIWATWIDSNFNSDNYKCSSTWSVSYSWFVCDDDIFARNNLFGYINNDWNYYNVFWNNSRINDYIANNSNNISSWISLPWNTSSWMLFLNLSWPTNIKLELFDKTKFDSINELSKIATYTWATTIFSSWYLAFSWSQLFLNSTTEKAVLFDFKNNNYWLFLQNADVSPWFILQYNIYWIDMNNYPVIINPIDDSNLSYFKFLWYDILLSDNKYFYKINEIQAPVTDDLIKNNFVN